MCSSFMNTLRTPYDHAYEQNIFKTNITTTDYYYYFILVIIYTKSSEQHYIAG